MPSMMRRTARRRGRAYLRGEKGVEEEEVLNCEETGKQEEEEVLNCGEHR